MNLKLLLAIAASATGHVTRTLPLPLPSPPALGHTPAHHRNSGRNHGGGLEMGDKAGLGSEVRRRTRNLRRVGRGLCQGGAAYLDHEAKVPPPFYSIINSFVDWLDPALRRYRAGVVSFARTGDGHNHRQGSRLRMGRYQGNLLQAA